MKHVHDLKILAAATETRLEKSAETLLIYIYYAHEPLPIPLIPVGEGYSSMLLLLVKRYYKIGKYRIYSFFSAAKYHILSVSPPRNANGADGGVVNDGEENISSH